MTEEQVERDGARPRRTLVLIAQDLQSLVFYSCLLLLTYL